MATLLLHDYQTHFCRFFINSEDELNDLPTHLHGGAIENTHLCCSYGSIAECLNGKVYRLSSEDKWIEVKGSSSSSSGGNAPSGDENDNIEPITDDEIDSLFKNNGGM